MITESPKTELESLRHEMELSSLGDKPQSISASKLRRLIELESQATESPTHKCNGVNGAAKHGTQNKCTVCGEYRNGWFDSNEMEVLLPPTTLPACPCCKSTATEMRNPETGRWWIECDGCGLSTPHDGFCNPREVWSRRTASVGAKDYDQGLLDSLEVIQKHRGRWLKAASYDQVEAMVKDIAMKIGQRISASPDAAEIVAESRVPEAREWIARGKRVFRPDIVNDLCNEIDALRETERRIRAKKD